MKIEWKKGSQVPFFKWGVTVEMRSESGGAVHTLARNVTTQGTGSQKELVWDIPKDPFSSFQGPIFHGRLLIWGLDSNTNSLVFGDNGDLSINYIDNNELTFTFVLIT